ncbi:MAG: sigma-54-dependent Fis family transcriptional regulator [Deltaproteobacteria bacterium]|nr:sigma-54-dependent Fis family transcriptional regulator [Deltaproteobacteria bacterium]
MLSELDRGAERVPGLEDIESPETADPKVSLARAYVELLAGKAAKSQRPVLIHGPTGSGKENLARRIHEQSGRKGPLVTLNAATLPSELVASELFGHVRGAFSNAAEARKGLFAEAHGGTLFLDEIAELPLEQQPALLRALQERKIRPVGSDREIDVDVRVIAATHQDLEALEKGGRFRADLLARIAVLRLELPGLDQRREEILPLFRLFLLPSKPTIELEAAEALLLYDWPKNVRELQQAAESIRVFLGEVDRVRLSMLPPAVRRAATGTSEGLANANAAPPKEDLEEALRRLRGNVAALANELGQHRNQLYRWFKLHDIDPLRYRSR